MPAKITKRKVPKMRTKTKGPRIKVKPGIVPLKTWPNLAIDVEPMESGDALYLPLAPKAKGQKAGGKLALRLLITNNESQTVTVTEIRFSFPNSSVGDKVMQGVPLILDPIGTQKPADIQGMLSPGMTAVWSNGVVNLSDTNKVNNTVFFTTPIPPRVRCSVSCNGFASPRVLEFDLSAYQNPTPTGAFLLPFSADDLRDDEYIVTGGTHWANGGAYGGQIFAYDIGMQGIDPTTKKLNALLPGKSGDKNADYRIWRNPIRAMADGVVESWLDTMATNSKPGKFPKPTPKPVTGNHFWIKHGDVYMLYAHLIKGTLPVELKVKGAVVKAGQFLGRVGNSGNSSNPHTHLQCHKGSTSGHLRGIPFKTGYVLEHSSYQSPAASDPWSALQSRGIPRETCAIWPASTWPGFKIPTVGISRGGSWGSRYWISSSRSQFEKTAQKLFDDHGYRLTWVNTFHENGQLRWAGIAQTGNWANSFWISPNRAAFEKKAQDLFNKHGRRLVYVTTYQENGHTRWVGIARGGNWANSFWISASRAAFEKKAQELFDKNGRRLVHVTTYVEGGKRYWVGIARSGNWANSFIIKSSFKAFNDEAQKLFDEKGRRLVHVHSFRSGRSRYWVGIARSGNWANSFYYRGDLDSFNREAQDLFDDKGRRLIAVEFLDD